MCRLHFVPTDVHAVGSPVGLGPLAVVIRTPRLAIGALGLDIRRFTSATRVTSYIAVPSAGVWMSAQALRPPGKPMGEGDWRQLDAKAMLLLSEWRRCGPRLTKALRVGADWWAPGIASVEEVA